MSHLASLKIIASKRPVQLPPVVQRRNKIINRLDEQILLAQAKQDGKIYAPMQQRTVKDEETGDKKVIQVPKRVREWFYTSSTGKVCISVLYGAREIELAKGKTAVELGKAADLIPTLELLKNAVADGELDAQIEAVSRKTKAK